jgi:endonuclease/exonuclease/phosphatase family metal-dependent hydrolase
MLKLVTFNAGLAVGVLPYATERVPHVARAIAELDADLVFLQEVWLDSQWDAVVAAARARFPHFFRPPAAARVTHGACSPEEVAPLSECARRHCDGLEGDELGQCVVRRCAQHAFSMSADCINCVVSHPVGTLDQILAPCTGKAGARRAPNVDAPASAYGPAGFVAYGGSLGIGFLSRLALEDRDVIVYPESTLNARGAVYARAGGLHVFGTHLSPGIIHEQEKQIDRLFEWIDEKAGRDAPTIVLGDLNTGPNASPSLYRRFVDAGFVNPYPKGRDALGTFGHGRSGWILDHILFRNVEGRASAERILDEPLDIDVGGRRVRTTYSDHCGVRATLGR